MSNQTERETRRHLVFSLISVSSWCEFRRLHSLFMIGYLSRRGEGVGELLWREREDFFFFAKKKLKTPDCRLCLTFSQTLVTRLPNKMAKDKRKLHRVQQRSSSPDLSSTLLFRVSTQILKKRSCESKWSSRRLQKALLLLPTFCS